MFVSRRNAVEKWRYARALSRPWCTRIPFHELPLDRLTRSMPTRPCRPVAAWTQSTFASSGTGLDSVELARAGTASVSHDGRGPVKRPARTKRPSIKFKHSARTRKTHRRRACSLRGSVMPRRITDTNGDEKILKQSRRAEGLTKLRSRLDQAMDEMLRLYERRGGGEGPADEIGAARRGPCGGPRAGIELLPPGPTSLHPWRPR